MKDALRNKMFAIVLLLIGILFIIESSVVLYVLGLFPPLVMQANPAATQFLSIGWGYGVLKLLVGLVATIGAVAVLLSK